MATPAENLVVSGERRELGQFTNDDTPITAIARLAASGAGTEVIEQMKKLVEWDDARRAKMAFDAAFSNAKRKFKPAKKSGYNAHLKSHYSTLEDLDDATRDALTEYGLSWRHIPSTLPGDITSVRCILAHRDGHREEAELTAPSYSMTNNAVNKLQSTGIVLMYLQRMTLRATLGIVSSEFDNDGSGGAEQETITEQQAADLQCMFDEIYPPDEIESQRASLLRYLSKKGKLQISKLEDIPAVMQKEAVALLDRKRKEKQAAK